MIHMLIPLLVIVAVASVAVWAINELGVPAPLNKIARVIIVVVSILLIVSLLFGGVGDLGLRGLR